MEIPYTTEARPDTGLYNAKVGIWLFLASEVMLFGALFSTYILLRVGAPEGLWPHGWLDVRWGTANTIVLITSSITTVMAWASLKLNQFSKFKFYHACTVLLALTFAGIKSIEYHDKFVHYEMTLADGSFADGHMVENKLLKADGTPVSFRFLEARDFPLSGYAVIKGRPVNKREELYDLKAVRRESAATEGGHEEHKEMRIEGSQIKAMSSYGPWHNTYTAIYFTLTGLHALHVLGGALVIGFLWGPGSKMWKTDPERFTNRIEISGLFWHFVDLVWIFLFPVLYLL
jgi:cytochrome c oxidase subunit 3